MSIRAKAETLLVIVTFFWGATFVIVKGALADASPFPFLALRFILAGALLFLVFARGGVARATILPGTVLGIFLFGGYAFQTWGLIYTTSSKCAFITGSSVIIVPALMVIRGARLHAASVAGGLLGLAGIYLLVVPAGLGSVNRGDVLTLGGAICFAIHIMLVGQYTRVHSFAHLVAVQILVVGLLSTIAWPADSGHYLHWTSRLLFALIVTAVFATAIAFSVQNWAQQFTPPAHTALIFALEPVFAALTSWVVAGERLSGKGLIGAVLILAGMVISERWAGAAATPVEG